MMSTLLGWIAVLGLVLGVLVTVRLSKGAGVACLVVSLVALLLLLTPIAHV